MIKRTLFFGNKSSLTTRNEQLIIKTDEKEASIPIEDIGFVVIENQESYISLPTIKTHAYFYVNELRRTSFAT